MNASLSLLVAVALAAPPSSRPPADPAGQQVAVVVDLSALPKTANPRIEGWILDDARKTLEDRGHRVADGAPHEINVAVSWFGKDAMDTRVTVRLDDGEPHEITCLGCDEEEWLPRLQAEVAQMADALAEDRQEPTIVAAKPEPRAGVSHPPPPTQDRPRTDERTDKRTDKRIGALGFVGIGVSIGGAVGLGVGLSLALREPQLEGTVGSARELVDTRPGGYVGLGVGGTALLTGVTLIVVDLVRHRPTKIAVLPTPQGVALSGRF